MWKGNEPVIMGIIPPTGMMTSAITWVDNNAPPACPFKVGDRVVTPQGMGTVDKWKLLDWSGKHTVYVQMDGDGGNPAKEFWAEDLQPTPALPDGWTLMEFKRRPPKSGEFYINEYANPPKAVQAIVTADPAVLRWILRKTAPQYRPFTEATTQVGLFNIVRCKKWNKVQRCVTGIGPNGVYISGVGAVQWAALLAEWERFDVESTWQPCGEKVQP